MYKPYLVTLRGPLGISNLKFRIQLVVIKLSSPGGQVAENWKEMKQLETKRGKPLPLITNIRYKILEQCRSFQCP